MENTSINSDSIQQISSCNILFPNDLLPEKKRSTVHFSFTMFTFVILIAGSSKLVDSQISTEDKIKTAYFIFNIGVVLISCIFLQTPHYKGFQKYFYKTLQSFAFAYFLNILFMVLLVVSKGSDYIETTFSCTRSKTRDW